MTIRQARKLRRSMSPPELALWQSLRTRPSSCKFRRQHPLGPYVLDFFCRAAMVAVEVDGDSHDMGDNPVRDERRDASLRKQGIVTLRFLAADVRQDVEPLVTDIVELCRARTQNSPLPFQGEGPPETRQVRMLTGHPQSCPGDGTACLKAEGQP